MKRLAGLVLGASLLMAGCTSPEPPAPASTVSVSTDNSATVKAPGIEVKTSGDTSSVKGLGHPHIVVSDNGQTHTYNAKGELVAVNGNDNNLTFTGLTGTIAVNGNNNTLTLQATVPTIVVNGSKNTIKWALAKNAKEPFVVNQGADNTVSKF